MHTQVDLRGPIPTCIYITNARQHDVRWLDELVFEPGAFYGSGVRNVLKGGLTLALMQRLP